MLKVVHISTSPNGGAGRAAFRLHEAMLNSPEICSTFITAKSYSTEHDIDQINIKPQKPNIFHKISNRLGYPVLNSQKNYHLLKNLRGNYENYTMPTTDYSLENLEVIENADIINLHWIANFVNFPSFFEEYKNKPIVWTLHDMNPFMGGFHYKNDFLNNPKLHALEEHLSCVKKEAIRKAGNLSIVTPSKWLMNEAILSKVYKPDTTFQVIPYSLNLQKFLPINRQEAKGKLSINPNLTCILIVADYLNFRKGFDILIDALKALNNNLFQVINIGNNKLNVEGNFLLKELGNVNNDELLAIAYSAADLFVLPSREDNLPNVMLESFSCGTPVLSFKTGGMQDWIIPGFNGFFTNSNDVIGLKSALEKFIRVRQPFDHQKIRAFALDNFAPSIQAKRYIELYNSLKLLNSNKE